MPDQLSDLVHRDPPVATVTQEDRDSVDALIAAENRRYIATHIMANIVSTYDPDNVAHVTRAAEVAVRFADALISKLS